MTKEEIQQIIQAVEQGNEEAFSPFYQSYYPLCWNGIGTRIPSREDKEDALGDAFFKFYKKFIKQKEELPKQIKNYIITMAINGYLDKKKRDRKLPTDQFDAQEIERVIIKLENNPMIKKEELNDAEWKIKCMYDAIDQLSKKCKQLILDRKIYELSLDTMLKKYAPSYKSNQVLSSKIGGCMSRLKTLYPNQ